MPTLLDTHAWVWWVTEDRRLSKKASEATDRAVRTKGVWLSVISIWEVAKKVEKQQLVLDRPLRQWMDHATGVAGLQIIELTPAILLDQLQSAAAISRRPADQMIVASARHHRAQLVTADRNLRKYPHVQTIW